MATDLGPRERMIRSAALLVRERGVEATALSDVLAHSGAPRGSIYHHFPGGKEELVQEATAWAADATAGWLARTLGGEDPVGGLRRFIEGWRRTLEDSEHRAGCPVVAVAVEGDRSPAAREAAGAAFARWEADIATALTPRLGAERAASIASLLVAGIEGAVVMARAERSTAPLDRVGGELERLLATALAV